MRESLPSVKAGQGLAGLLAAVLLAGCVGAAAPASGPGSAERPRRPPGTLGRSGPLERDAFFSPYADVFLRGDYDLPVEPRPQVESELSFLVGQRSEVVAGWLARGDRYRGFIWDVLREHGLPTDLYHLAMIESGFVPTARSHAGAVGMWQFMASTGRSEGLRVDTLVDERMDPVRSTRAAARHLRGLHRAMRGDWSLTAAAYNAGTGRIARAMQTAGVADFWTLAERGELPAETRRYVPRLYAVTAIARNRERFGFGSGLPVEPFSFDSIHVEDAVELGEIARIGGLREADLMELNPHLVRRRTPVGGYWVWVPPGTGPALQRTWLAGRAQPVEAEPARFLIHEVAAGETLWGLAERYDTSVVAIRDANGIGDGMIQPGQKLRIPASGRAP